MTNEITGPEKLDLVATIADYMGTSLNEDAVEVYKAYYSNTYAIRVDEDFEYLYNAADHEIEEVEFAAWPPTELN